MTLVHGTCIALDGTGVLIRGPSGSGKSDLALRLIDEGARLVADDQVSLAAEGGGLRAQAPEAIAGMMEVRGLGLLRLAFVDTADLRLVVDLAAPGEIERLPENRHTRIEGIDLPLLTLAPFEASAPAKVRLAVRSLDHDIVVTP